MNHRSGRGKAFAASGAVALAALATVLTGLPNSSTAQLRLSQRSNVASARLPEPPRELRRALAKAERAIAEGQFSDAVAILNELLEQSDDRRDGGYGTAEDYFLDPRENASVTDSFKRKALRLLGTMPPAGREIVELQLGRDARRGLQRALEQSDAAALQEVSRRFFHTAAGYEATYLLARYHMDHLRPLAAALQFKRLREAESARKYEPELSLLYAVCLMSAEQAKAAEQALLTLRQEYPTASFEVAGETISIPTGDADLVDWITALVGRLELAGASGVADWTMSRGTPDRNGFPNGGMPLAKMEFHVDATPFADDGERVALYAADLRDSSRHALPVMEPLAVGPYVLMRTPRLTYGVDLNSGLRIWPYPWNRAERIDSMSAGNLQATPLLTQRIFSDATYGRMSSDGKALFVIIDPKVDAGETAQSMRIQQGNVFAFQNGQIERPSNQLAAIDLEAEGKSLWIIGGADSGEPRLAGAYFLGAPLPLDGQLYAIVEWKDEIKLVVLDAETGSLLWTQQLAEVDAISSGQFYAFPRISGCTPAYSNGILVCPTASGALVAVDVATRSLLWGYPYKIENPFAAANMRASRALVQRGQPGNQWVDNIPIIANGTVVHTPVASNRLHCINLLTGERRWRARTRALELYVAGIVGDQIISVTYNGARATSVETGENVWKTELEDDAATSGRGFISGRALFLPTTNREVVKIRLADGKIVETVQTDYELGNLICHGNYVISQNYDALRVFRLRDQTRTFVNRLLAENPNDVLALEDHVSILLGDGKREEALVAMRKLASILAAKAAVVEDPHDPDLERLTALRRQQTRLMLDLLEDDYDQHQALVDEVRALVETPEEMQRFRYMVADHQFRQENYLEAFREYVELLTALGRASENAERELDERSRLVDDLVDTEESDWSVSKQRWIAMRFQEMLELAGQNDRGKMLRLIEQRLDEAIADEDADLLRTWWQCLPDGPQIDQSQLVRAQIANRRGQFLRADMALREVDPASPLAPEALAQRATMLARQGWVPMATAAFERLAKTTLNAPLANGKSGKEMFDDFIARQGNAGWSAGYAQWTEGRVIKLEQPELAVEPVSNTQRFMEVRESSGDWPESYRVAFDTAAKSIMVYDGYGALVTRVPFGLQKYGFGVTNQPSAQFVKAYGNLLVLSIGTEVIAMDVISEVSSPSERVLWTSDARKTSAATAAAMPFSNNRSYNATKDKILFTEEGIVHATIGDELMGQLGPVGRHGVCYIDEGDLYCVDALTGHPHWVRRNVGTKAEIYGDDDCVFVIDPKAQKATVFDTATGAALGKRRAPRINRRWRRIGRSILTWDSLFAQPFKVRFFDSWLEEDVWSYEFDYGSRGCMISNDELAMLTPDGEFNVIRISDGKRIVQELLEAVPTTMQIAVQRSRDDYILVTFGDRPRRKRIQVFTPNVAGTQPPLINGRVYCFDRQTGQSRWAKPLEVNEFGLAPNHPADVPVLAFVRNVNRRSKPNQRFGALVCIDRRSGDLLFANYRMPRLHQTFRMRGDPDGQSVNVQLGNDISKDDATVALKFTDEPRTRSAVDRLAPVEIEAEMEETNRTKKPGLKALDDLFGSVR